MQSRRFVFAAGVNLALVALLYLFSPPTFHVNDDGDLLYILSGSKHIAPSPYTMYIHVLWAKWINLWYSFFPSGPWYALWMIIFPLWLAHSIGLWLLLRYLPITWAFLLYAIYFFILGGQSYLLLSFTIASTFCSAIVLLYGVVAQRKKEVLMAAVLFLWCSLLRFKVPFYSVVALLPLLWLYYRRRKIPLLRFKLLIAIVVVPLAFALYYINRVLHTKAHGFDVIAYNNYRELIAVAGILDHLPYQQLQKHLQTIQWDTTDLRVLQRGLMPNLTHFSIEKLEYLAERGLKTLPYKERLQKAFVVLFQTWYQLPFYRFMLLCFLANLIFLLWFTKEKKGFFILFLISFLYLVLVHGFIGVYRFAPLRLVMGVFMGYVFFFIGIITLPSCQKRFFIVGGIVFLFMVFPYYRHKQFIAAKMHQWNQFMEVLQPSRRYFVTAPYGNLIPPLESLEKFRSMNIVISSVYFPVKAVQERMDKWHIDDLFLSVACGSLQMVGDTTCEKNYLPLYTAYLKSHYGVIPQWRCKRINKNFGIITSGSKCP